MEVKEVLFMRRGDGEHSYSHTFTYTLTKPVVTNAVLSMLPEEDFPSDGLLNVADLGCANEPSTVTFMSTIVDATRGLCEESGFGMPEFQFYLNDLVGNDFNYLFKVFVELYSDHGGLSCFVVGTPGSFHGRLFPRNSLHLVHSSYSVHWLSKVPGLTSEEGFPLNKGKIYISEASPPVVKEAYLAQFRADFSAFLRSRSEEMVSNRRLVLILHGRRSKDSTESIESSYTWCRALLEINSIGEIFVSLMVKI